MDYSYIDKNVGEARRKIEAAAAKAGRDADDVLLLAAIKSADADEVNYLHRSLEICDVGENRVQQLLERYDKLDREGLNIHFIGSLQTNKVKYIIDKVSLIHSLDSDRLAAEIQKQAQKKGIVARVLVEINSGNEENKGGIEYGEVADFCRLVATYPNIEICGFMTMAPRCESREQYYGYFNKTAEVARDVWYNVLGRTEPPILSMGMSESFDVAVECGATVVRIGRSLFARQELS